MNDKHLKASEVRESGNLKPSNRHATGMSSLVAEVITVAVLDYKRKRVTEEAKTAKRDGRKYAGEIARKERDQLRVFIFGGSMDWMIDLADLNVSAQAIREKLRGRR